MSRHPVYKFLELFRSMLQSCSKLFFLSFQFIADHPGIVGQFRIKFTELLNYPFGDPGSKLSNDTDLASFADGTTDQAA